MITNGISYVEILSFCGLRKKDIYPDYYLFM